MSGHIVTGGVFVSGTRSAFDPRVDDLEVDLTTVEEVVDANTNSLTLVSAQQTINTSNIGVATAGVTANTQAIGGLNAQQTINTTAIGIPAGPGMLYNINQNDIGRQFNEFGISANTTSIATNTTDISAVSVKANANEYVISQLDTVFVEKNGSVPQVLTGQLNVVGTASTTGNLDVGVNNQNINGNKAVIHAVRGIHSSSLQLDALAPWYQRIDLSSNHNAPVLALNVKGSTFLELDYGNNTINHYKSFTNASDDRLKENEELIENACETLSKLRPQLYEKKSNMEDMDPTTWYKESGLIAQEIYYDTPELRHLVIRGRPELDEDGNIIPLPDLPDIPTSIDPQEDPDYSSWGENPATVNYIGLIAYLIKANNELNERVKVLEMGF